jgi:hypothetical protein
VGNETDGRGSSLEVFVTRWPAVWPFLAIGLTCTIAGGLIAAVSRPTQFTLGSWLAAYLVLIGGVAPIGLGSGQALLAESCPTSSKVRVEVLAWNAGLVAVIVGTLVPAVPVTMFGGVLTALALATFISEVRHGQRSVRWAWYLYMGTACFVLVSTPIGLALAWLRHS